MVLKYNLDIDNEAIEKNIKRIINQTYKLLPCREEDIDWQKPLSTLIEEICGMKSLMGDSQDILFSLLCKMEGLFSLTKEEDFQLYRRTIFECLSLLNSLKKCLL